MTPEPSYPISHTLNTTPQHTHTLLSHPPQTPQICQISIRLSSSFPSPPSSSSSSAVLRLSLHLVTCVIHSWPTCCLPHTHVGNVHTCQSDGVHQRWGEGDRVFVSEHLSIFNLKLKLEEFLSSGVSRTNNWRLV